MTKGRLLVSYYYSYVVFHYVCMYMYILRDIKLEHKLQTYGSDQRDPFFCMASSKGGVEGREGWAIICGPWGTESWNLSELLYVVRWLEFSE